MKRWATGTVATTCTKGWRRGDRVRAPHLSSGSMEGERGLHARRKGGDPSMARWLLPRRRDDVWAPECSEMPSLFCGREQHCRAGPAGRRNEEEGSAHVMFSWVPLASRSAEAGRTVQLTCGSRLSARTRSGGIGPPIGDWAQVYSCSPSFLFYFPIPFLLISNSNFIQILNSNLVPILPSNYIVTLKLLIL
jgi:hypothetical protein